MKRFLSVVLAIVMLLQTAAFAVPGVVTSGNSVGETFEFEETSDSGIGSLMSNIQHYTSWSQLPLLKTDTYYKYYFDPSVNPYFPNNAPYSPNYPSEYKKDSAGYYVYGNCTWYCWARASEMLVRNGKSPLSKVTNNASAWYNMYSELKKGNTPKTNSIAVYSSNHVRYIDYADENTIIYSESGYYDTKNDDYFNGGVPTWICFKSGTATKNSSGRWVDHGSWNYNFNIGDSGLLGYIYLDIAPQYVEDSGNDNTGETSTVLISTTEKSEYTTEDNIKIEWNTVSGATSYGLTITRKTGSSWESREEVYDKNGLTGNSVIVDIKLPAGEYRFNMGAYSSNGSLLGDYSERTYFTVVATSGDESNDDSTDLYPYSSAYKSSQYYTALKNVKLTGDYATDIVNVAFSQLGYHEGNSTADLGGNNSAGSSEYTEYNKNIWNNNGPNWYWCATFVSWCARHANVPKSIVPNFARCSVACNETFPNIGVSFVTRQSGYIPKKGDFVFFNDFNHVAIIYENSDGTTIKYIDGNGPDNDVSTRSCTISNSTIDGYISPKYKSSDYSGETDDFQSETIEESIYAINSTVNTYRYLTAKTDLDGGQVEAKTFENIDAQKFKIVACNDGYQLVSLDSSTGKVVNVYTWPLDKSQDGYNVTLWKNTGDASQVWLFKKVGDAYAIYPADSDSVVLTAMGNGAVNVTTYSGAANQLWYLTDVADKTVTYNPNGGTGAPESQTKTYGTDLTLSSTVPEKTGYTFLGWSTTQNGNVEYDAGATYSANENVTLYAVWKSNTVYVTGITLNKASATLEIGNTEVLTATVSPSNATNKNVTWTSSDENVATVANGLVTAIGEGKATITVTTVDGGKSAICTVTVTKPEEEEPDSNAKATYTFGNAAGYAGEEITVDVKLAINAQFNTIGFAGLEYDKDSLTFEKCTINKELKDMCALVKFDKAKMSLVAALRTQDDDGEPMPAPTEFDGVLCTLTFSINNNAPVGTQTFVNALRVEAKNDDISYTTDTVKGTVTICVPVTSVVLDKTTATLEIGDTATLTATVAPSNATNKNVTWTSSDENVATVENGVVTAVGEGKATITVKTANGNKTDTCTVTVKKPTVSVTGITLNKTTASLEIGNTTTLAATVSPSNATNKNITWSSSDENVATVANGLVTAIGEGKATITVTTVDGNKTATCEVTVTEPEPKATVTLSNETGRAGDKVSVIVSLNTDEIINTIGFSGITYDKNVLTFDGFTQYDEVKDISILSSFDEKMMAVTIALEEPQSFNGKLFEINFIINENAEDGKSIVDLSSLIKLDHTKIVVKDIAGSVTVISELLGDINHDDYVDMNDAVLLLQHSMFPHLYPIEYKGSADFTKDGYIDMNDAVRLLQYSMFPHLYPIE